jgi:hypothetical protein
MRSLFLILARDIKRVDESVIAFNRQVTYYESIDTNIYAVKRKYVAGIIYHDGHKDCFDSESMNLYLAARLNKQIQDTGKENKPEIYYIIVPEKPWYAIKWNPSKILANELAFSFEYKQDNKATEIELGYLYPSKSENNFISSDASSENCIANCYNGVTANLFLKHYCPKHFYYGLSALFKYMYFKNTWIYAGEDYAGQYNINCSQTREVYGLSFRCGFLLKGKHFIFEPYAALGLRVTNSNITFNYYIDTDHSYITHNGQPDNISFLNANGLQLWPYLNLGFKIGFGWNEKNTRIYKLNQLF